MRIRFVNHASFICEYAHVRLLIDPWLFGSAFNDGWDLICKTKLNPEQLFDVEFIWFSHEHPDHFSPSALLSIPEHKRETITVLYQQTRDGKVLEFCSQHGFRTKELSNNERYQLAPEFHVTFGAVPIFDSWLFIETPKYRLLNLNDAPVRSSRSLRALRQKIGSIDVLFTQFSYAGWHGNEEDTDLRREQAKRKLDILRRQIDVLEPQFTVPFASFSFFSHEENNFMNDAVNLPSVAVEEISDSSSAPVLLYPNDVWDVGEHHNNESALRWYDKDYASLSKRILTQTSSVHFGKLEQAADHYRETIFRNNSRVIMSLLMINPLLPALRPVNIYLWDLDIHVCFSFRHNLKKLVCGANHYHLSMASDSLYSIFSHRWAIETLTVNARFRADARGLKKLIMTFGIGELNNVGIYLSPRFLIDFGAISYLLGILFRKLRRL